MNKEKFLKNNKDQLLIGFIANYPIFEGSDENDMLESEEFNSFLLERFNNFVLNQNRIITIGDIY